MSRVTIIEPNARLMTTIVSESGSLLIYEESTLIWAAQLTDVPVAIQRSNLNGLAGAIVTLRLILPPQNYK